MLIADSSFLVALFLPNDSNHKEALKKFIEMDDEIYISNIILYETLTVINYKGSHEEKRHAYNRIVNNKSFVIDYFTVTELEDILQEFLNSENKLSFTDASIIYLANKSKLEVICFDSTMQKFLR